MTMRILIFNLTGNGSQKKGRGRRRDCDWDIRKPKKKFSPNNIFIIKTLTL